MKLPKTFLSTFSAAAVGLVALGLSAAPVQATATSASFAVTATVAATCSVSASPLTFGTYSSLAASTFTSAVSVTCTTGTPATFLLSAGSGTSATVTNRQMQSGLIMLPYTLSSDAEHTSNFGTVATVVNGTGNAVVTNVYGQIAAGQYVTPGAYTDTITATVTY